MIKFGGKTLIKSEVDKLKNHGFFNYEFVQKSKFAS